MGTLVDRFDRGVSRTLAFFHSVFSYILLIAMGLVTLEVISRYYLRAAHDFADEGIVHLLLFAMFGGAAMALENDRHINMDLIEGSLKGQAKRATRTFNLMLTLIGCTLMAFFSGQYTLFLIRVGAASETTIKVPYYLGALALFLAMVLTGLSALRKILVLTSGKAAAGVAMGGEGHK